MLDHVSITVSDITRRPRSQAGRRQRRASDDDWLPRRPGREGSEMLRNGGFGVLEALGMVELAECCYGVLGQGIVNGPGAHVVRAGR